MSNKVFIGFIVFVIVGSVGYFALNKKNNPAPERLGTSQQDKGQKHVEGIEKQSNKGGQPPTSGDHAISPLPWQVYDQEIPDSVAIHNLEHGGIYISYRPDVPKEQIDKIKAVFFEPFSIDNFTPNKVVLAPRPLNESPIILSSWTQSQKFESFDEEQMVQYYRTNVGKSPEAGAQ